MSTFNGSEPGVSLAGEASTGSLGVDYTGGAKSVGILLSRSTGEGEHLFGGQEGRISARLAGLDPGYRQELWQGHSFWNVAGYGRGLLIAHKFCLEFLNAEEPNV